MGETAPRVSRSGGAVVAVLKMLGLAGALGAVIAVGVWVREVREFLRLINMQQYLDGERSRP